MIWFGNTNRLTVVYLLPLVESILAFLGSFLLFAPLGSLRINSCRIEALSDWYSIFYNPSIDYYNKIDCSQEVWRAEFYFITFSCALIDSFSHLLDNLSSLFNHYDVLFSIVVHHAVSTRTRQTLHICQQPNLRRFSQQVHICRSLLLSCLVRYSCRGRRHNM